MKRLHLAIFFLAALFALAFPALAQTVTLTPGGSVSVTCAVPGTPPPGPVDPAPPPPPPPPPPPAGDPCAGMSPQFSAALAQEPPLELWAIMFRMGRGLTDAERACARARGVPGSQPPTTTGNSSDGTIPTTGFVFGGKGNPLKNWLAAGVTYDFVLPATAKGEAVLFRHGEMPGTPDSMRLTISAHGPSGELLAGPEHVSSRFGGLDVVSPGGALTYRVTPSESGQLSVQRN